MYTHIHLCLFTHVCTKVLSWWIKKRKPWVSFCMYTAEAGGTPLFCKNRTVKMQISTNYFAEWNRNSDMVRTVRWEGLLCCPWGYGLSWPLGVKHIPIAEPTNASHFGGCMQGLSLPLLCWRWCGPRRTAFGADYVTANRPFWTLLGAEIPIFQNAAPWRCSMQPGGGGLLEGSGGVPTMHALQVFLAAAILDPPPRPDCQKHALCRQNQCCRVAVGRDAGGQGWKDVIEHPPLLPWRATPKWGTVSRKRLIVRTEWGGGAQGLQRATTLRLSGRGCLLSGVGSASHLWGFARCVCPRVKAEPDSSQSRGHLSSPQGDATVAEVWQGGAHSATETHFCLIY